MKALLKKFFSGVKEWFVDAADHIRLLVISNKINNLNKKLDWAVGLERHEVIILLELYSWAHNKILARINARDVKHRQTAKLITIKFRFVYCDGVWHRVTYPQTK